jgi:hypothetical protein
LPLSGEHLVGQAGEAVSADIVFMFVVFMQSHAKASVKDLDCFVKACSSVKKNMEKIKPSGLRCAVVDILRKNFGHGSQVRVSTSLFSLYLSQRYSDTQTHTHTHTHTHTRTHTHARALSCRHSHSLRHKSYSEKQTHSDVHTRACPAALALQMQIKEKAVETNLTQREWRWLGGHAEGEVRTPTRVPRGEGGWRCGKGEKGVTLSL